MTELTLETAFRELIAIESKLKAQGQFDLANEVSGLLDGVGFENSTEHNLAIVRFALSQLNNERNGLDVADLLSLKRIALVYSKLSGFFPYNWIAHNSSLSEGRVLAPVVEILTDIWFLIASADTPLESALYSVLVKDPKGQDSSCKYIEELKKVLDLFLSVSDPRISEDAKRRVELENAKVRELLAKDTKGLQ